MTHYSVKKDQGVAGPESAITAETTALYTCIGIVMRNAVKKMAGLYHYGANQLEHNEAPTKKNILAMINYIEPTLVYITAPPVVGTQVPGQGSGELDRIQLDAFLGAMCSVETHIEWTKDRVKCSYHVSNGSLLLNQQSGSDPGKEIKEGQQALGSVQFYGV